MKHVQSIESLNMSLLVLEMQKAICSCKHPKPDGNPCDDCQEHLNYVNTEILDVRCSIECLQADQKIETLMEGAK